MPKPTSYICTKCNFKGSTLPLWGEHSYLVNGHEIPVNRDVAVCYGCNSIVSVEVLPSSERVKELESSLSRATEMFYEGEKQRLVALENRKSPARCLECGSIDFEIIPDVKTDNGSPNRNLPVRTGLFHRECGGRIYAEFRTPYYVIGEAAKRIFSIEGIELTK